MSAVENAFVWPVKCSDSKREGPRGAETRERQVYLRLPEEITVDRDDACRRMHSLIMRARTRLHANDIINLDKLLLNFDK